MKNTQMTSNGVFIVFNYNTI